LLAQDFAISDMTFSMQDSPSWFGHLYAVAATTDGFTLSTNPANGPKPGDGWGCDSGKTRPWAGTRTVQQVPACIPDPALTRPGGTPLANGGAFQPSPVPYVPTIMDRLDAAGLPWRIYGAQCTAESVSAKGLETCTASNGQYVWSSCASFAECLYTPQNANLVPNSQFIPDATSGNLSAFSLITAGNFVDSEHNGASMTTGDNWLGQTISAVMSGRDWASTAIFITFDDCGCFYDQVPPGTNPDGTRQGPRLPLIIVSPYARPGYTDTTPATFASILAYVEHTFGLAPLGRNDAHAYDFAQAFNYSQAPLKPTRLVTRPLPPSARHIRLTPAVLNDPS
jgi:phospholipase C